MIARSWPSLLVLSLCLGLSLANAARAPDGVAFALVAFAATAVVVPGAFVPVCALTLALTGWWWGSARLDAFDRSVLAADVGTSRAVVAVVTGPVRATRFNLRVSAEIRRFGDRVVRERVLLQLPLGRSPPQGAVIALRAAVAAPRGPDEGFDERAWLGRRGVHVILRGGVWRIVGHRGGVGGVSDRLRAHIAGAISPGLRGERRAVLEGIVLGEDEGLTQELRLSFKASGLYHLLAVSGQNIAFIVLGVLGLAWVLGIPRLAAEVAALAAIGGYVLAVGWQPSVVRAGVAGALASLAWLAARPRDRWHFLALGAAALLLWTPASLLEPGFQLSFAAVGSIFLVVPRLRVVLEGYPLVGWLREAIAVSIACGAATAPILWLQFGAVQLYTLPANVLVTLAVGPLLGLALIGALVAPLLPSVAVALAYLNGWVAAYIALCARVVGGLPYAQIGSGAAVAVLLGTPVALVGYRRLPLWRRPAALACAAAILPALVAWQVWPVAGLPPPQGLRITFLDVGQGDATLLQVPEGAVLVDQGPPEADVAEQLRRLGLRRLAAIVLTHPQRDHIGGAPAVLRRLAVDRVLDPGLVVSSEDERAALATAGRRGTGVEEARTGDVFQLGRLRLRVLWPNSAGSAGVDPNQLAIVLLASYGDTDVLLSADAETDVTARLLSTPVEILKVAHHGSADPGLGAELRQLRPQLAVISCGRGNDYGHPHPVTLAALRDSGGIRIYRTDEDGRVVVETDGRRLGVRTER